MQTTKPTVQRVHFTAYQTVDGKRKSKTFTVYNANLDAAFDAARSAFSCTETNKPRRKKDRAA